MNKSEALKQLRKLFGKNAGYRINESALTGEKREALRLDMPKLNAIEKEAIAKRDARRNELLKDPEYVRLAQEASNAIKERQDANGRIYARRVTIGIIQGGFFVVKGDGDNWAEAISQAKGEK